MVIKILQVIDKVNSWCLKNIVVVMVIFGLLVGISVYLANRPKTVDTVVVNGVSQETVEKLLGDKGNKVYKEITTVQKLEQEARGDTPAAAKVTEKLDKKYDRVHLTPEESTKENINKVLEEKGGDKVIVDVESNITPGTTIYSIKNVKRTVGAGLYASYREGLGKSYGLHYRNNRMIYQLGVDDDGKLEARIAYEVFQW
jgi:hypothetical protein